MFFSKLNTLPADTSRPRFDDGLAADSAGLEAKWFATPFL